MSATITRIRVTCDCSICETNAKRMGADFPLAAEANVAMAKQVGVTDRNANKASKTHGLVYAAHDPSLVGSTMTAKFGPWAV